jgi:hypothetical protein
VHPCDITQVSKTINFYNKVIYAPNHHIGLVSVNSLIGVGLSTIFLMMLSGYFLPYFSNAFAITDINFAAVGDFNCPVNSKSNQWETINNIKSRIAERVLGLGDYSYLEVGNADCWINIMHDFGMDLTKTDYRKS